MESLIEKIKKIEKLVCENFEDIEIDDPIEEGTYDEYKLIVGATDEEIQAFEETFDIHMPEDIKELYRYKNGSKWLPLLFPDDKCNREFMYRLLSLDEIGEQKKYFQNKNTLLSDIYSYDDDEFTTKLMKRMEDSRVKPYILNKRWFPFAETLTGIDLMIDFDPNEDGIYGQIICYIHDPDEIAYVAKTITNIIDASLLNFDFNDE